MRSWRPNLRDEADNHVVELAVAGGAETRFRARAAMGSREQGLRLLAKLDEAAG